jgi:hypothetical protein
LLHVWGRISAWRLVRFYGIFRSCADPSAAFPWLGSPSSLSFARSWPARYFSPSGTSYYPVTNTADDGPGSLRSAIAQAGDGDVVYFDAALNGQTINLTSGELAINSNINFQGPGANQITVQGLLILVPRLPCLARAHGCD